MRKYMKNVKKNGAYSTFLNCFAEQLDYVHSLHSTSLEALCPGYENALNPSRKMFVNTDSQYS